MNCVVDFVMTGLASNVSQKTNKPYWTVEGTVVNCPDCPVLIGAYLRKFIDEEVFKELAVCMESGVDRVDLNIGISRAGTASKCDLGLNVFINGLPKDEPPIEDPLGSVSDKSNKGGK